MQLDTLLAQAAGEEIIEETNEDVVPEETEETNEDVVPEEADPAATTDNKPKPEKPKSNPVKEIRDRLNAEQKHKEKIENAIQRFTEGDYKFKIKDFKTEDGKVDYDALISAMDSADLKVRADNKNISPEVQAEIERIEKEKQEIARDKLRVAMDRAIANMQTELSLSGPDINNFFKDSMALNKNPYMWLNQGGTLQDLYYLVYRERLTQDKIDKAVEEAKAQWEAANNKKAPTSNPAAPTPSQSNNTMTLDQMLSQAFNK